MSDESIRIPYDRLSSDVLEAVIEEFVLREGTDYGPRTYSLDEKVSQVLEQLKRGEVEVVFDPTDESCTIVKK